MTNNMEPAGNFPMFRSFSHNGGVRNRFVKDMIHLQVHGTCSLFSEESAHHWVDPIAL